MVRSELRNDFKRTLGRGANIPYRFALLLGLPVLFRSCDYDFKYQGSRPGRPYVPHWLKLSLCFEEILLRLPLIIIFWFLIANLSLRIERKCQMKRWQRRVMTCMFSIFTLFVIRVYNSFSFMMVRCHKNKGSWSGVFVGIELILVIVCYGHQYTDAVLRCVDKFCCCCLYLPDEEGRRSVFTNVSENITQAPSAVWSSVCSFLPGRQSTTSRESSRSESVQPTVSEVEMTQSMGRVGVGQTLMSSVV